MTRWIFGCYHEETRAGGKIFPCVLRLVQRSMQPDPPPTTTRSMLASVRANAAFPAGPPPWPAPLPELAALLQSMATDGSWGRYHGPHGERLSDLLRTYHVTTHVKLCSSGTVGVELALRGLGISSGDEVALAGYDFAGNFRAIERVGARPVLLDIDSQTLAIRPELLPGAESGCLRAVIVSHLHSGIAPLPEIMDWADRHDVRVIEDICQAHGAWVHGRIAGTWGDMAVLSFGGSKLITAGRGGAVLTRSAEYDQRLRSYAEQGNDAYPLSELQAAVILPQWHRLDQRNILRRRQVARLRELLADTPQLALATCAPEAGSPSYYKVAWWWRPEGDETRSRDDMCRELQAEGIAMDAGFRGFAKRSARRCRHASELAVAAQAAERLMVLHHPILLESDDTIARLATAIRAVCERR